MHPGFEASTANPFARRLRVRSIHTLRRVAASFAVFAAPPCVFVPPNPVPYSSKNTPGHTHHRKINGGLGHEEGLGHEIMDNVPVQWAAQLGLTLAHAVFGAAVFRDTFTFVFPP